MSPTEINPSTITGFNPPSVLLTFASEVPQAWSATVAGDNWLTLSATNGIPPSSLTVTFSTVALAAGLYTNAIEVTVGALSFQVPVTLDIKPLNVVKMATDYQRPYIYALQAPTGSLQNGLLLFINTTTEAIEKTLPIGLNPTDLTVHYGDNRLYISSWQEDATYVVDLTTQTLLAPLHLGTDVYKINAGRPGQLVIEGEDQWITASLINTTNGATIATGFLREGDGEFDPTGRYYYHSDNNISGAGVTKYDLSSNSFVSVASASGYYYYGSRNVVLSPDGTRLFWTGAAYDADLNELGDFDEEIYATTAHGDLALGAQHVFNARNGQLIYTWPFSTSVMAVSGDQQKVFLYNAAQKQLVVIPMSEIADVPGPGLNPTPADGEVVNLPLSQLSWTPNPFALSYRVFLGTNQTAVTAADTNSPLYLGTTSDPAFSIASTLSHSVTYYWRVDSVGFNSVTPGAVWSFITSPLSVSPQSLQLKGVKGLPILPQTISLSAVGPTSWTLSVAQSWMSASITSGTTPSSVTLSFNTANLTSGVYTNQLSITANGITLQIPVVLELFDLVATRMVVDWNRNYIYVLHAGSGNFGDAFLLFLNTDTGIVEKAIPIGNNPTDLTVNRYEDRLYVSNWQHNQTRAVDLATKTELAPLELGTDIYKLNAAGTGRLITEGEDQWIDVNIVDTATGDVVGALPWPQRQGDGEFDPTGSAYYHCDDNISDAHIHKYQLVNDTATEVAASLQHPYGSRNLVLAPDGTRLFWRGYVYDNNLNELGYLGEEIYATTAHGDLALGDQHVFNARNGQLIYAWPFSTSVMAVSRDQQKVFLYDGDQKQLVMIPMSEIADIPGPGLNPTPADGAVVNLPLSQISWTPSLVAFSYRIFFGTNPDAVAKADIGSPLYLGTTVNPGFSPTPTLETCRTYYWRVDSVGFDSVTTGAVWSFITSPVRVSPPLSSLQGVAGLPILPQTISLSADSATTWSLRVAQPWMSVSIASGTVPSSVTLSFDTAGLTAGVYTNQLSVTANDTTLQLPIVVELFDLIATRMVADRNRDYIYVLHAGSGGFDDAFLLFLNTDTGIVEKVIPIGSNPTDLTVNRYEDRLYVSNWQHNQTRVVDLATKTELAPLELGTDIYKLNAAGAGRLITEGEDQWIGVNIVDTATGDTVGALPWPQRQGDGESDPVNSVYYHCDDNISNAHIHKYQLVNNSATEVAASSQHPYGSRNLVLSPDGARLFWRGYVYDDNLNELGSLGQEIHACTTDGSVAFSDHQGFDTATQQAILDLPASTSVMAVDRFDRRLWYFDDTTHQIGSIRLTPSSEIVGSNVVTQIGDVSIVVAGDPVCFSGGAAETGGDVNCHWEFGDGSTTTECNPCHVFTNCGPYTVGGTISDSITSSNTTIKVAVPCAMTVTQLRARLDFAKPHHDGLTIKALVDLGGGFGVAGKSITLDIGGAQVSFTLDESGRGISPYGTCRLTFVGETQLWRFSANLNRGTWQTEWAAHGLANTTIKKPGVAVVLPVILLVGEEAFMTDEALHYSASGGKSGIAQ